MEDYKRLLKEEILNESTFVRASFTGTQRGSEMEWVKLAIRPVMLKQGRHLQFSYFDQRKDITKNYSGDELMAKVDEAVNLPFANFHVQTTAEDIHVRISKKGKPLVSREKASRGSASLVHDREKQTLLAPDAPFLQAVGITTADGRIKSDMIAKYKQINQFLELIVGTGELEKFTHEPVRVIDCGCGSAYLTFATYDYLSDRLELSVQMTGIDIKADVLAKHTEKVRALGWRGLEFVAAKIIDYTPDETPDMVLALHACDTASDEAIAQGIKWGSKLIIAAPCCHHDLQAQLNKQPTPLPFMPVMRHGILHERLGDILTDSFRALLLRIMGYRTDVVQFVDTEHTPKNLMIRAVKTAEPGDPKFVQEYHELKKYWSVTPYLEKLLADELRPILG